MSFILKLLVVLLCSSALLSVLTAGVLGAGAGDVLFREDFDHIDSWEPLFFPKIKKHSSYSIESAPEGSYLKAESSASASALLYKETFNVYDYPKIRWRWKAINVYRKGNVETKEGDDYPARFYIIFKYDPEKAGFLEKLKYSSAKLFYGKYPPHSALNYIWASREQNRKIIVNSFSDKAMMIIKRGPSDIGIWQTEYADIIVDYVKAFGEKPPATASIAIMNDSDNTGEASVSYIDFIEIYR